MGSSPTLRERRLGLRVGIHCGPATAGVIGDTRFAFDVWGDAVNTASRMESHSLPGRIQVSEAFRSVVGDVFLFEERGSTEIKGIGTAHTFFLVGAEQAGGDLNGRQLDGVRGQRRSTSAARPASVLGHLDRIRALAMEVTQRLGQTGEFMRSAASGFPPGWETVRAVGRTA